MHLSLNVMKKCTVGNWGMSEKGTPSDANFVIINVRMNDGFIKIRTLMPDP